MLSSGVMGQFPFRIDDRPFSNLDQAIAGSKTDLLSGLKQFNMRPTVAMIVDVIRNLSE